MRPLATIAPLVAALAATACQPHYAGFELRYVVGEGELEGRHLEITEGQAVVVQIRPVSDNPYEDYESFDLVELESYQESILKVAPSTKADEFVLIGAQVGKTNLRVSVNGREEDTLEAAVLEQPEVGP